MAKSTSLTPFGDVIGFGQVMKGIYWFSANGHEGYFVTHAVNQKISENDKLSTRQGLGMNGWYVYGDHEIVWKYFPRCRWLYHKWIKRLTW